MNDAGLERGGATMMATKPQIEVRDATVKDHRPPQQQRVEASEPQDLDLKEMCEAATTMRLRGPIQERTGDGG